MGRGEGILYKGSFGRICQILPIKGEIDGVILIGADFIQKRP